MKLNDDVKPGLTSLIISASFTGILLILIGILVVPDLEAGAGSGASETGWGILIATILFGPLFLISLLITLVRLFRYRQLNRRLNIPSSKSSPTDETHTPTVG